MPPQSNSAAVSKKATKAKLVQERSRATCRQIVKSAMHLWTQRGFDQGFDTTTVDEIAEHAKISRATVYYYFPKKEDILRELAWIAAEDVYEIAVRSLLKRQRVDDVLDEIMQQLGAMVSKSSRAAVHRMLQIRKQDPDSIHRDFDAGGLTKAFSVVLIHAQEAGELPARISSTEIAEILASICMGCISKWSIMGEMDLTATLRRRAAFVLAGARASETTEKVSAKQRPRT